MSSTPVLRTKEEEEEAINILLNLAQGGSIMKVSPPREQREKLRLKKQRG